MPRNRQPSIHIMPAIQPNSPPPHQRPIAQQLQPSRPFRRQNPCRHRLRPHGQSRLMPQQSYCQSRILGLMPAGQRRQRQAHSPLSIAIRNRLTNLGKPIPPALLAHRPHQSRRLLHFRICARRIIQGHQRRLRPSNPRLLKSNPRQRLLRRPRFRPQQKALVINPQRSNPANRRPLQHIGSVQPPPKPHLNHTSIRRKARKSQKDRRRRHLKKARLQILARVIRVEHLRQQLRQQIILDQPPSNADPLIIAHQMRLGCGMHDKPLRLQHHPQIGAGAALAIGARHMKHRRHVPLRIAQPPQQFVDNLQPKPPLRHRQLRQPPQLRGHFRMFRCGEIHLR